MYNRHIDIKNKLAFIDEKNSIEIDTSFFPGNITFYIEYKNDWWIEKKPFNGPEKDEVIKHIALKILNEATEKFEEQEACEECDEETEDIELQ